MGGRVCGRSGAARNGCFIAQKTMDMDFRSEALRPPEREVKPSLNPPLVADCERGGFLKISFYGEFDLFDKDFFESAQVVLLIKNQ